MKLFGKIGLFKVVISLYMCGYWLGQCTRTLALEETA